MEMKQASVYTKESKWQTVCCKTTSKGKRCSKCGRRPEKTYIKENKFNAMTNFSYQEDQSKRVLSHDMTQRLDVYWDQIEEGENAFTIQLIFKKDTGFLSQNTPFGMITFNNEHRDLLGRVLKRRADVQKGLLIRFLRLCFRDRGITYRKPEEFIDSENGWIKMAELLRTPELQHIPLPDIPLLDERERVAIHGQTKGKQMIKTLLGHNSPYFVSRCQENIHHFYEMKAWTPYFKKAENARRVLEEVIDKKGVIYHPLSSYAKNLTFFHKGMQLLTELHEEETVWANRLLTLLKKDPTTLNNPVEIIGDIARMSENIWEEVPEYSLPFNGKIEELHDKLVKDRERLVKVEKTVYRYDIQKEWEQQVKHYTFQLAKDSVELSKIGSEMNICVGSYNQQIIEGETHIMWMKQPGAKHTDVCIEIQQDMIVQAKMKHNDLPRRDLCFVIQEWAETCDLEIVTNDIRI